MNTVGPGSVHGRKKGKLARREQDLQGSQEACDRRFLFSEKTEQEMEPTAQLETLHTLKEDTSPSSQTGRRGVRTGPERDKWRQ